MERHGTLIGIQVGRPQWLPQMGDERVCRSAIIKTPVVGAVWLGKTGVEGDEQADPRVHGGPDKAVNVYAAGHYPHWREELALPAMAPGAFGENFTVDGMDEWTVCIGDVYQVGEACVQVSQPRGPCWKIGRRWRMPELPRRVMELGWTGWYLRVLTEGRIETGVPFVLVERPEGARTIAGANEVRRAGNAGQ